MVIQISIQDNKAKSFISFLKELDFVKIQTKAKDAALSDADIIFGIGEPATDAQLKKYLAASDSDETKELNQVCEEVIAYLGQKKK